MMHLEPELAAALGEAPFEQMLGIEGEVYRAQKNRRTMRVVLGGAEYFVKVHGTAGWLEILKHVTRGRAPVLTSRPETEAIKRLHELGIPTLDLAGYGWRGRNPARLESFLVTRSIEPAQDLKVLIPTFLDLERGRWRRLRRHLVRRVAEVTSTMHRHGMNHRDLYTNHFLVPERDWSSSDGDTAIDPVLIDLHRVQIRARTPERWIAKDLSGLLFSSFDARLETRDLLRFLRVYWGDGWKERFRRERRLRATIVRRAVSLYRSETGNEPPPPGGRASSA